MPPACPDPAKLNGSAEHGNTYLVDANRAVKRLLRRKENPGFAFLLEVLSSPAKTKYASIIHREDYVKKNICRT
jgi:hypothetical protein